MVNKSFIFLINFGFFLLTFASTALAETPSKVKNLCEEMNLGWHFYCDKEEIIEPKLEQREEASPSAEQAQSELKEVQKTLEDLKVRAVMYPTKSNLKDYIAFQQAQLERASKFSNTWQKVLWENPDLDYMVKSPLNSVGNELRNEIKNNKLKDVMKNLNSRYGLFFFYSTACSFCKKFSPILKVFANTYDLSVLPVSMDRGILSEWPETVFNQGQAERFGMVDKPVPATVLFDNQKKTLIPVGFGLLTVTELEERIFTVIEANEGRT